MSVFIERRVSIFQKSRKGKSLPNVAPVFRKMIVETACEVNLQNDFQRPLVKVPSSEPQQLRRYILTRVVESALKQERLDLWGEYEQVGDDELINIIIPALSRASWKGLDLRRNQITLRGVAALAKALTTGECKTLKELCLGSIGLGDDGLRMFANFMGEMHLETLKIFDNAITDCGIVALCNALPRTGIRHLDLSSNTVTDDGALCLRRAVLNSGLRTLMLNMNHLTSFGADELVESFKHSSLTNLSLRGNDEIMTYSSLYLGWVMGVCRSEWYSLCITLNSAKSVPRLGSRSSIQMLPSELLRQIITAMYTPEMMMNEYVDTVDDDDDDEQEERTGFEEDYLAAVTHHKRRCSSLSSIIMETFLLDAASENCDSYDC